MSDEGLLYLGKLCARAVLEVIETAAGIGMEIVDMDGEADASIMAIAALEAGESGVLTLRSDAATLRVLTSYMTGVPEADLDEEALYDCIHELMNMTVGLIKAEAKDDAFKFRMIAPFVVTGEHLHSLHKPRAQKHACRVASGDMFIELWLFF